MTEMPPSGPAPPTMRRTSGDDADGDRRGKRPATEPAARTTSARRARTPRARPSVDVDSRHLVPFLLGPDPPCARSSDGIDAAGPGKSTPNDGPGTYQPALDGVRAVSVVAALLFHAGVSWMSGGYLGAAGLLHPLRLPDHPPACWPSTSALDAPTPPPSTAGGLAACCRRASCASLGVCLFAAGGALDGAADLRRDFRRIARSQLGHRSPVRAATPSNSPPKPDGASPLDPLLGPRRSRSSSTGSWPLSAGLLLLWASCRFMTTGAAFCWACRRD